ncbi:MAG: TerC family protein [Proteobacteria bacterium]|nr:TerC family protein [Pseudomonadota bacterium]
MPPLWSFESLVALLALTGIEIILGIDNIVFIALLSNRVAPEKRAWARRIGLIMAMATRILFLLGLTWTMSAAKFELFTWWGIQFTGKNLILLGGGLFLLFKATHEVHKQIEGRRAEEDQVAPQAASFFGTVLLIGVMDIVFSIDSVITAIGMARHVLIMIVAIVVAVIIMIVFAGLVSRFIERHPSLRILALAFLILIGVFLVAEGIGQHIQRGYIYFAMAFSLGVEMLNLWAGARRRRPQAAPANKGG